LATDAFILFFDGQSVEAELAEIFMVQVFTADNTPIREDEVGNEIQG
jgi:hypothetical protein